MKVLFLIPNLTPGGIQTQVILLAKFLIGKGHSVKVAGFIGKDNQFIRELKADGIEVIHASSQGQLIREYHINHIFGKFFFWLKIIKWLRGLAPDVILPYTTMLDDRINAIWRFTGAKQSFSFERGGHFQPSKEKDNWLRLLKRISKPTYVANSNHGAKSLALMRGIPLKKIHLIRNAYEKPNELVSNFVFNGIDVTNKVVFVMVANFFDQKDHMFLLEAWKAAGLKKSVLVLAGLGGTKTCIKNYHEASEFVKVNNLEEQVLFLGAVSSIQNLLHCSAVGVLTSKTEGCPNAILEYMGAGLPVLARDIPGVQEILPESNKGLLTKFDDIDGFSRHLVLMEKDEVLRTKLGEMNKKHVIEEFKPQKMFDAYYNLMSQD